MAIGAYVFFKTHHFFLHVFLIFFLVSFVFSLRSAWAQPAGVSLKKSLWELQQDLQYDPEIPMKGGQGEIAWFSSTTRLSWTRLQSRKLFWGLRLSYEHHRYDSQGSPSLLPEGSRALTQAFRLRAGPFLRVQWDKHWGTFLQMTPSISMAYQGDWGESFEMTTLAFASYKFSDRWSLNFGAIFFAPRVEDNILVVPIIGFEGRPTSNWRFGIGEGSSGPGFYSYYRFRPDCTLKFNVDWSLREFRLAASSPIRLGSFEDMSIPVRLALEWKAPHDLTFEPYVGVRAWSRFDYLDERGHSLEVQNGEPSFFFGLIFKKAISF